MVWMIDALTCMRSEWIAASYFCSARSDEGKQHGFLKRSGPHVGGKRLTIDRYVDTSLAFVWCYLHSLFRLPRIQIFAKSEEQHKRTQDEPGPASPHTASPRPAPALFCRRM